MISRGHRHWFLALLPPVAAFLVQLLLWPLFHPSLWFLFYPAVFLSSWIGGLRAAVVASLASAVAAIWFFIPPERSFAAPGSQYFAAAVFVATSVFFGLFHDRLRAANLRAAGALVSAGRANDRLQHANEAIASLLEQAPDGVLVATPEGRLTEINEAGCRMFGCVRDETIGERLADLLPPEGNAQLKRDAEMLRGCRSQLYEWELRSKDGSILPVEVSVRILSDGRWQLFVRDLTARRRLEEASARATPISNEPRPSPRSAAGVSISVATS